MTFFSGTDRSTLQEEGAERNHFVSLIVNNAGTYTAAITRKIKYKDSRTFSYESFNGKVEVSKPEEVEGEAIEYFLLDIEIEGEKDSSYSILSERLDKIKEAKKAKIPTYTPYSGVPSYIQKDKDVTSQISTPYPSLFKDNDFDNYDYWKSKKEAAPVKESTKIPGALKIIREDEEDSQSDFEKVTRLNKLITPEIVKSIVAQLLTGSVAVTDFSKVITPGWTLTMKNLFDKRFGTDHNGKVSFEFWAQDFIQFLLVNSVEDDPLLDPDSVTSELAVRVSDKLSTFTTNDYIDIYLDILLTYM